VKKCLSIVTALAVAGVMAGIAMAEGDAPKAGGEGVKAEGHKGGAHKAFKAAGGEAAVEAKEMTLTGKVTKDEMKDGEKTRAVYNLVQDNGEKVRLPGPRHAAKGGDDAAAKPAINLDDFVGQAVKIVAMGGERKGEGKVRIWIKEIKSIEKVPAAAPAGM
jgi:hypothetical protein